MHIVLTKVGNAPKNFTNSGKYCGSGMKPNEWYICKSNKPDAKYTPDYCALKYEKQKYLYIYMFTDFSHTSTLREIFLKQIEEDDIVCFFDGNQCAVLSNHLIGVCKYDYETECVISDDGELLDSDDVGGDLCFADLNKAKQN